MNRKNIGLPSAINVPDENTKRALEAIINYLRQLRTEVDKIKHNKKNR